MAHNHWVPIQSLPGVHGQLLVPLPLPPLAPWAFHSGQPPLITTVRSGSAALRALLCLSPWVQEAAASAAANGGRAEANGHGKQANGHAPASNGVQSNGQGESPMCLMTSLQTGWCPIQGGGKKSKAISFWAGEKMSM